MTIRLLRQVKELLRNKLRFTRGWAGVLSMAIELGGLTWAFLCVPIMCMHRGARPKVSLRWQDLRLNARTQNDYKFRLCMRVLNENHAFLSSYTVKKVGVNSYTVQTLDLILLCTRCNLRMHFCIESKIYSHWTARGRVCRENWPNLLWTVCSIITQTQQIFLPTCWLCLSNGNQNISSTGYRLCVRMVNFMFLLVFGTLYFLSDPDNF